MAKAKPEGSITQVKGDKPYVKSSKNKENERDVENGEGVY